MKQKRKVSKFVYWTPRILSIILILFLVLMSLDIFEMNLGFWGTILGLFMHNIPALILLIVLVISWKHEIAGAIAFALAGLAFITLSIFLKQTNLYGVLVIAGPAILISVLFYLNWKGKRRK